MAEELDTALGLEAAAATVGGNGGRGGGGSVRAGPSSIEWLKNLCEATPYFTWV
jgi:hypothetical protein